jgi:hypothetical protein
MATRMLQSLSSGFARFTWASGLSWVEVRPALLAAALALALLLAGGLLRRPRLQSAACGAGLLLGWGAVAGLARPGVPGSLPLLALAALVAGLLADGLGGRRSGPAAGVGVAVLCGWFLAGAPHSRVGISAALPALVLGSLATLLAVRALERARDPWRAAAAGLALLAGLMLAHAPAIWIAAALAALVSCLGWWARLRGAAVLLPSAVGLAVPAVAAALGAGRPAGLSLTRTDLAALAPALALWLAGQLGRRFPGLGRTPLPLVSGAASALAIVAVWLVGLLAR